MAFSFAPPLRLRHLNTVLARNLNPKPARHLLSCFFTLVVAKSDSEGDTTVFKSETLHNTLNPTWAPLESSSSSKGVIVKIWQENPVNLLLERKIVFNDLAYLGPDTTTLNDLPLLPQNSVLFQLETGLFVSKDVLLTLMEQHSIPLPMQQTLTDDSTPKFSTKSVKTFLSRASYLLTKLAKTEDVMKQAAEDLTRGLESHKLSLLQERRRDAQSVRIKALQTEAAAASLALDTEKAAFVKERSTLLPRAQKCVDGLTELVRAKQRLKDMRHELNTELGQLEIIGSACGRRRQTMLRSLHELYQCGWENSKTYTICGTSLPAFDTMGRVGSGGGGSQEQDEEAVALGFAAALIYCLGKYLQVPLRFPVKFAGGRSTIYDYISQPSKEAQFPLYSKGELRTRFEYGVDLLNADVEQLLASQGIQPEPPRPALYSLHRLCTDESSGAFKGKMPGDLRL